jgi:hypothetical protein
MSDTIDGDYSPGTRAAEPLSAPAGSKRPTHRARLGRGGHKSFATHAEMLGYPAQFPERCEPGMTARVARSEPDDALRGTYVWEDGAWSPEQARLEAKAAALDAHVSALQQGQTSDRITATSWAELQAKPGAFAGQGGEVVGLLGTTHMDPASGTVVSDGGVYAWSTAPARWDRIGDNAAQLVASRVASDVATAVQPLDARLSSREQQIDNALIDARKAKLVLGRQGRRSGKLSNLFPLIAVGGRNILYQDVFGRLRAIFTPSTVADIQAALTAFPRIGLDGRIPFGIKTPAGSTGRGGGIASGVIPVIRDGQNKAPITRDRYWRLDFVPTPGHVARMALLLAGKFLTPDANNRVTVAGIKASLPRKSRRSGPLSKWQTVMELGGRQFLRADAQGRAMLTPAPELIQDLKNAIGASSSQQPLTSLRGGFNPYSVELLPDGRTFALLQEKGRTFSVHQRNDVASEMALANGPGPIRVILVHGQSNAFRAGTTGENPFHERMWPHHAFSFTWGEGAQNNIVVNPNVLTDFAPLQPNNELGLSMADATAFALEQFLLDDEKPSTSTGVWTANWPGNPITNMMPGTRIYTNLMLGLDQMIAVARQKYQRDVEVIAHIYCQGETDSDNYAVDLTTLMAAVKTDSQAKTGQSYPPRTILMQINVTDNKSVPMPVPQIQYEYAKANPLVSLQPMYYTPLRVEDQIHGIWTGKLMNGERMAADLMNQLFGDGLPQRFWPTSIVRTDNVIRLTYPYPVAWDEGTGTGGNGWVKPNPQRGFRYFGDDSAIVFVTSVQITGTYEVTVTLSATPTAANRTIGYARAENGTVVIDGWTSGRGQLCSPTGRKSPFQRIGVPIPPEIFQYAAAFEERI